MALKLHDFPFSPNGRKVRIAAIELGIPLDVVNVDLMKGEHKAAEYLKKNPNGKVPLLEEDGWFLFESSAITRYLASKKPGNTFYPSEPKLSAQVEQWLAWDHAHLAFESCFLVYRERMFGPMTGTPTRDQIEKSGVENFNRFAAVLNGACEGKQYLVGNAFTAADAAVCATLMFAAQAKLDLAPYPHLRALIGRVEARDSWKKTPAPPMG